MKRPVAIGGVALLVGIIVIAASPAFADPFANGSFETPSNGTANYVIVLNGQKIGPWTVTGTSVDWLGANFPQSDGVQSIELAGSPGPGGVIQTFDTVAGATYKVDYDIAKRSSCASASADVRALVNGTAVDTFTFLPNSIVDTFITRTFTFTATEAQTALEFDTTVAAAGFGCGTILDNVRVAAATSPSTSTSTTSTSTTSTSTSTTTTSTTSTTTSTTSTTSSTTSTSTSTTSTSTSTTTSIPTSTTSTTRPTTTTSVPPLDELLDNLGLPLPTTTTTAATGPTSTVATTTTTAPGATGRTAPRATTTTAPSPTGTDELPATGPAHRAQLWALLMLLASWSLGSVARRPPATDTDHASP